jgi:hypothetical protein
VARLFLVVALLAGWQAALQHPIEHVDERGALVHVPGDEHDPLCDLLAALTACVPERAAAFPPVASQYPHPACPEAVARAVEPPPFLSRGPPRAA